MKRWFAVLLVLCSLFSTLLVSVNAEDDGTIKFQTGKWKGKKAGTVLSDSAMEFKYGNRYEGKIKNNVPAGKGTYQFRNGKEITGTFAWSKNLKLKMEKAKTGKGPNYIGTDMTYTGMTVDGKPCGYGELNFKDGGTFYGEFKDGSVRGYGVYVYREPESKTFISGSKWKLVSRIDSDMGGRWYSGLTLDDEWQGYGMLCYNKSYYIGEVYNWYCEGHGTYCVWSKAGDPSGTLSTQKTGHYRQGKLQYEGSYNSKTGEKSSQTTKTTKSTNSTKPSGSENGTLKKCTFCNGMRVCKTCNGSRGTRCTRINCNNGICAKCGGRKEYMIGTKKYVCSSCSFGRCTTCGGDGQIECKTCNGSGECKYCKGTGLAR